MKFSAANTDEMHQVGRDIAANLTIPCVVYLNGDLGAGKTTLSQGIASYFGYDKVVSSPTYNLIHEYPCRYKGKDVNIAHLDLYRLDDPEEVEMLGLSDLYNENSIFLVEWPEKGAGRIPQPDIQINISYEASDGGSGSGSNSGRTVSVKHIN